ncbi:hypothetical protein VTO42DRAFT_2357 [Malbranchea cinnamomea]
MIDYASTKGAIVAFTRSLSKNLSSTGIRVNAVAPGPVHTPIQVASRPPEQMEGFGSGSQIGRPGQPSEIAPTFVFLATAEAALYCMFPPGFCVIPHADIFFRWPDPAPLPTW